MILVCHHSTLSWLTITFLYFIMFLFGVSAFCCLYGPITLLTKWQFYNNQVILTSGKKYSETSNSYMWCSRLCFCEMHHNAYDSCEQCVQHCNWCGNVVLSDLSAPLRTNNSLHSQEDKAHHTATSPFSELQCGMITSCPLDYMHLVCLGIVCGLINLWMHGPKVYKLSQTALFASSDRLA